MRRFHTTSEMVIETTGADSIQNAQKLVRTDLLEKAQLFGIEYVLDLLELSTVEVGPPKRQGNGFSRHSRRN